MTSCPICTPCINWNLLSLCSGGAYIYTETGINESRWAHNWMTNLQTYPNPTALDRYAYFLFDPPSTFWGLYFFLSCHRQSLHLVVLFVCELLTSGGRARAYSCTIPLIHIQACIYNNPEIMWHPGRWKHPGNSLHNQCISTSPGVVVTTFKEV
jgi:hypothetical protein